MRAACWMGVAAVVVTRDAQMASWADRVVFLRDGRIVDQAAACPAPSPSWRRQDYGRAGARADLPPLSAMA